MINDIQRKKIDKDNVKSYIGEVELEKQSTHWTNLGESLAIFGQEFFLSKN